MCHSGMQLRRGSAGNWDANRDPWAPWGSHTWAPVSHGQPDTRDSGASWYIAAMLLLVDVFIIQIMV